MDIYNAIIIMLHPIYRYNEHNLQTCIQACGWTAITQDTHLHYTIAYYMQFHSPALTQTTHTL